MTQKEMKQRLDVPRAIIIAGIIIAGSILLTNVNSNQNTDANNVPPNEQVAEEQGNLDAVLPITEEDHVRGSRNAELTIVEYSDFECPFCKRAHEVFGQIVSENENVAWVYRHYPLDSLHPVKARAEAIASECAARQGGDEAFWEYADLLFERGLTNNRTDIDTLLPQIAEDIGLDMEVFTECYENRETEERVERDIQNAQATGGQGTPWNILITKDGEKISVPGYLPYEDMSRLVNEVLK